MKTLSELDWNFDTVPDNELALCCLWEYARESAFIRKIRNESKGRSVEAVRMKLPAKEYIEFVERDFKKAWNVLLRSAIFFQEGIYGFEGDENFVSPFPRPWQSLSQYEQSLLLENFRVDANKIIGFPGFRRSNPGRLVALTKKFKPKSLDEVFGENGRNGKDGIRNYFHSGHKLRSVCPNYILGGLEVLLVEIDWAGFTNEQLVEEFAGWLKENNPPDISRPDQRGRSRISERIKLERLAIMRLLHTFTLAELRTTCPSAWKHYNSRNRRWCKDLEMAFAHFRELFPFVPQDEFPSSWPQKACGKMCK
jgi:hypothetical protein